MTSILLVKTSSLGDVVHNLPAVSDIRRHLPDASIDWVVEESYQAIPRLHPAVRSVIPVNLRRWRRQWWRSDTRAEMKRSRDALRATRYDFVIDTQGLMKSALLARAAQGPRHGLDWHSAREPLAWLYDRAYRVPWTMHAVERNRELTARVLGYRRSSAVDYGIESRRVDRASRAGYAVLLHSTSGRAKLWREDHWITVAQWLATRGLQAMLPWGSAAERARSERLASRMTDGAVPQQLTLAETADWLAGATMVVGLDTGLTHLAGALGVPTVAVFVATDPSATGLHACARGVNTGGKDAAPTAEAVIRAAAGVLDRE